MSALSRRRLRLIRGVAKPAPRPGVWQPLAAPVDAMETQARSRAQSLLCGLPYRDGTTNPDTLTLAQAQDVLRWATARIL